MIIKGIAISETVLISNCSVKSLRPTGSGREVQNKVRVGGWKGELILFYSFSFVYLRVACTVMCNFSNFC